VTQDADTALRDLEKRLRDLEVANPELRGQVQAMRVDLQNVKERLTKTEAELDTSRKESEGRYATQESVAPLAKIVYGTVAAMIASGIGALVIILKGSG
jgi:TolA-binding protein